MRLHYHTTISTVLAGILYLIFKSWALSISCFITGIFIDIDHVFDVIRENGWSIKVKDFFRICHKAQFEHIVLLWHGWEWLFLWTVATWLTDWNPWMTGALIGLTHHIVLDVIANNWQIRSYSLIWRWKQNFHFDTTFPNMTAIKYEHIRNSANKAGNN